MIFTLSDKTGFYLRQHGARARLFFAGIVFVLGVFISFVIYMVLHELNVKRMKAVFDTMSGDRVDVIKNSIDDNISMLETLVCFYASSEYVSRQEFRTFTAGLMRKHSDIAAFNWIPRVKDSDISKFMAIAQTEGVDDFYVRQYDEERKELVRAAKSPEYYPVYYIEPFEVNKIILGLDMSKERDRKEAIERAGDTGLVSLTRRISLIRSGEYALRVFAPVYKNKAPIATLDERRENLKGFASILIQLSKMVEYSLLNTSPAGIDIYIYDINKLAGNQLLYFHKSRTRSRKVGPEDNRMLENGVTYKAEFNVGGRRWMVICKPAPSFCGSYSDWQAQIALALGLICTILLTAYLLQVMGQTVRAEAMVQKRTAELRQANDELKKEVTQRKVAEELAYRAKEQADLIYKIIPSAIFTLDNDCHITSWNDKAAEITGYKQEEVIGEKCSMFLSFPCSGDCELFKEGVPMPIIAEECVVKRKDGETIFISKNADHLKDLSGNIIGGIESFDDITERKKEIERLLYLTTAVDQSPAVVVMTDVDGNIQYANPKFYELTGYGPEEILRKNPRILKSGELPQSVYEDLWKTIRSGKDWHGEFHNKKKGGELFWENALLSPIVNQENVIGYIKVSEDITARKETEGKLAKAMEDLEVKNKELEKLDKLKSEFVSTVSHELRTPLSITKEGISLVLDKIPGPVNEKQERVLNVAKDNIDRLSRIINDLLDISKIEAGKVELKKTRVDMTELIKQVSGGFDFLAKQKNIELKFVMPEKSVYANIDMDRITQVATNLFSNAIKFTERGSVEIRLSEKEDSFECSVIDSGIGISKSDLPKIFDKFQQFSRTPGAGAKGTGLGLSIVKGIVELHKGRIWVESEIGKGSKFSFVIPKGV